MQFTGSVAVEVAIRLNSRLAMDGTGARVPIGRWTVLRLVEVGAVRRKLQVHSGRIKDIFNATEIDVLDAPAQRTVSERRTIGR